MTQPKISILLPSRGRTDMLMRSLQSLVDTADSPEDIEFLLGFDDDDVDSSQYFLEHIAPILDEAGSTYMVLEFKRMGYNALHQYLNQLADHAQAPWWVFWNDDAVMIDSSWDTEILKQGDKFCIQAFNTHTMHPYSIFPIVPRAWFDLLGHLSLHQLNDAYISQIAWMMNIMVRIPIRVEHERFDLTGKNEDDTYKERIIFEGNVTDPRDFNHIKQRQSRIDDANKICKYLKERGYDMSYWESVVLGKQDPWAKMMESDINNHLRRIDMPKKI